MVQTVVPVPRTGFGRNRMDERLIARTSRVAEAVAPDVVAVTVAVRARETLPVLIGKLTLVRPAGTVTDPGTTTAGSFELSATQRPLAGAGPLSVTVPVAPLTPPTTESGSILRLSPTPPHGKPRPELNPAP